MAYKKQSKRKTPLKQTGYTPHQGRNYSFNELDVPDSKYANRLGKAVGSIGGVLGDAVEEYKNNKEDKEVEEIAEVAKTPHDFSGFETNSLDTANPEAQSLTGGPDGKPLESRGDGKAGTYTYEQFGADAYQKAINEGKSPTEALTAQSNAIASAKGSNQKQFGTLNPTAEGKAKNYVDTEGGNSYVPGSATGVEGATTKGSPQNSRALQQPGPFTGTSQREQRTPPFNRSPFHRNTALMRSPMFKTEGVPYGDLARSSLTNLSYLGSTGQAAAEGYNSQVDRHNYKQLVRENQQKELDEEFGELEVAPTGFKPYDASKETLTRGWKKRLVDAKKAWKSGKMSNEDYTNIKHELAGYADSYAIASGNLQESMKNWLDNKDNISSSTKPEIVDFFDTMEKAPDSLTVQDIDGVPTFVGQTLAGKDISMPVDQIANGTAAMRFNTTVDVGKELAPTLKEIEGIKTDMKTQFGRGQGNISFDNPAIQQRVELGLDKIVNNNAKLRSIAAENLGWEYDEFEDRLKTDGIDVVKDLVKGQLKEFIKESYFPETKTTNYDSQPGSTKGLTAGQQQSHAVNQAKNNEISQKIANGKDSGYQNFLGLEKIQRITKSGDGYRVKQNGKTTNVPEDQIEAYLANVTGYTGAYGSNQGQARQDVSAADWLKNRNKK